MRTNKHNGSSSSSLSATKNRLEDNAAYASWIGGSDVNNEGQWQWLGPDGSWATFYSEENGNGTFAHWADGEPNNGPDKNEGTKSPKYWNFPLVSDTAHLPIHQIAFVNTLFASVHGTTSIGKSIRDIVVLHFLNSDLTTRCSQLLPEAVLYRQIWALMRHLVLGCRLLVGSVDMTIRSSSSRQKFSPH